LTSLSSAALRASCTKTRKPRSPALAEPAAARQSLWDCWIARAKRFDCGTLPIPAAPHSRALCAEYVEGGSYVFSDAWRSYNGLSADYVHQVIDHAEEYVRGNVHTNGIENFRSLLKRGLKGTYVSVEPFHLFRYLDEQAFRYNNRKDMDDRDRFEVAVSQIVGKRLTYKTLTGKNGDSATPF
jgi:hypothetical protein